MFGPITTVLLLTLTSQEQRQSKYAFDYYVFYFKGLILGALLVWNVGYLSSNLPHQSQNGQTGYNDCGTDSSSSSMCQTLCTLSLKPLLSS